jgi:hypothetical protein
LAELWRDYSALARLWRNYGEIIQFWLDYGEIMEGLWRNYHSLPKHSGKSLITVSRKERPFYFVLRYFSHGKQGRLSNSVIRYKCDRIGQYSMTPQTYQPF